MDETQKAPSNGQLFKQRMGYSKSMKRAMDRNEASSLLEYRLLRKQRKKDLQKLHLAKHREKKMARAGKTKAPGGSKKKKNETKKEK